jgi:type II secretory pathway pseudopilin PulG
MSGGRIALSWGVFVSPRDRSLVADSPGDECGFTLVEALVSMALLSGALLSVASLFAFGARANADAHQITLASMLARDKLEELCAAGQALDPSPADSLARSYRDFADVVDRFGQRVGDGGQMPATAVYVRRWSIRPSSAAPEDPLVIEVVVGGRLLADGLDPMRSRGTVRLATLTRSPS